jgi:hypothetical protein
VVLVDPLLHDMLFFDDLVALLLDVRRPVRADVHVGRVIDRLLATYGPLLDDFFLFHGRPSFEWWPARVQDACQL